MSKIEEGALPAPSEQRNLIKRLIEDGRALCEGDTWYPLEYKWWDAWRSYVVWETEEEVKTGDGPGPIDNKPLQKEGYPGVLRFGLREDYDHVLVSAAVWKKLHGWFGGGPAFPRKVLVSDLTFQARIELYPQFCRLHKVLDDGTVAEDSVSLLVGRALNADQVLGECCGKLVATKAHSRLWAKVAESEDYILAPAATKMGDIAGDDDVTDLAVETQTRDGTWKREVTEETPAEDGTAATEEPSEPFDEVAWRAGIKVGDHLDAQDSDGRFFESIVTEVSRSPKDSVKVHYRGWAARWDAWIERSSPKLQPLFTKVKNFRDFRVNDKLEYKHNSRWFEATVVDLNAAEKKVQIRVTNTTTVPNLWLDAQTELLCALGTHCKKPRVFTPRTDRFRRNRSGRPAVPGAVGLQNLGNTCFMNSMLQCLSNTERLTKFFMSNEYRKDINIKNPLGMGGRLAESYAKLLGDMWTGEYTVVCPTSFKHQIGQYAPQFAGYQQQDSQELMNFLLDGLHEDLNRVKKKPATETVESKGRPDAVVAREAWDTHLLRNRSAVVDMFMGQLKSDVTCDKCSRQSITFDPFLSLSVPIPVKHLRDLTVTYIAYDGAVPLRYSAKVEKAGAIADVKTWFKEHEGWDPDTLVFGDTYHHRIFRFLSDKRPISEIRDNDVIFVYRIPAYDGEPKATVASKTRAGRRTGAAYGRGTQVPDHELTKYSEGMVHLMYRHGATVHGVSRMDPHGDPRVLSLYAISGTRGEMPTNNQVHEAVFTAVKRLIKNRDTLDHTTAPYTIKVMDKAGSGHHGVKVVPKNDEKIVIDPLMEALYLDFTAEAYRDEFDFDELVHWEPHNSFHQRIAAVTDLTIQDCLDAFAQREQLGEHDKWYCSNCKEHRQAFKKFDLWKLPEILVIHLKRFQYSQGTYFVHRNKIDHLVDFPFELDMASRVRGPQPLGTQYELYAVSNHSGGLGGGHYTAYGKNFRDGRWYNFNDSHVSAVSDKTRAVSPMAYVLFYRRKAVDPDAPAPAPAAAPAGATAAEAASADGAGAGTAPEEEA